jgi:hypothetical protein
MRPPNLPSCHHPLGLLTLLRRKPLSTSRQLIDSFQERRYSEFAVHHSDFDSRVDRITQEIGTK